MLVIHDIGFRLVSGRGDTVKAIVNADWINSKGTIPYSAEFQTEFPIELNAIKTDAAQSRQLIVGVLDNLFFNLKRKRPINEDI